MINRMILLSTLALLVTPITWGQGDNSVSEREYTFEIVYQADGIVFALETGEFDPAFEEPEVAVLVQPSHVIELIPGNWASHVIHQSTDPIQGMHNRPTLAIGKVLGNDTPAVVSTSINLVTVIYDAMEQWNASIAYDKRGYIGSLWGTRVGDYDPRIEGEEMLVINETVFDFSIADLVTRATDIGTWKRSTIYGQEVGMDSAVGEFDPNHEGPEIVITTEMGPTYQITAPTEDTEDQWPRTTIWDDFDNAGWVVKIADVYPDHPGNEIIYGTRYNNKLLISYPTDTEQHQVDEIFQGLTIESPMWDIAVGNIIPETASDEIVAVDNGGYVYLVWYEAGEWRNKTIWQTDGGSPLYAVTIGEFDPEAPGLEILVGGEDQNVTMLSAKPTVQVNDWLVH